MQGMRQSSASNEVEPMMHIGLHPCPTLCTRVQQIQLAARHTVVPVEDLGEPPAFGGPPGTRVRGWSSSGFQVK